MSLLATLKQRRLGLALGVVLLLVLVLALLLWPAPADRPPADAPYKARSAALGLPQLPLSAAKQDPARIALGRKLFFDRRLSFNGSMSCAMCHVPEEGFSSNASRTSVGAEGVSLQRNAPTLLNVAWRTRLFHDGRETGLSTQAWMPLLHPQEMANPSIGHVLERIAALPDYARRFEQVYPGAGPSMMTLGDALAAFQTSLVAADSRFDRWRYGGQALALTPQEQQGFALFTGKARCAACHTAGPQHALFSDGLFHVTGAGLAPSAGRSFVVPLAPGVSTTLSAGALAMFAPDAAPDLGRFEITLDPDDRHAFSTPSLRNVSRTAPYMHDGSLSSLDEVIDFYDRGGGDLPGKSALLRPLGLSPPERQALLAFLRALDGQGLAALVANSRSSDAPMPAGGPMPVGR